MAQQTEVDVFISGGGPVGMLLAYQLAHSGLSVYIVEQHDKLQQAAYGRAGTLYPRSLEVLDQLDLIDDMLQVGFICRGAVTYDKEGKNVHGRGWSFIHSISGTFFDFMLSIRQRYFENIVRAKLELLGTEVHAPAKLTGLTVDDTKDEYKVTAEVEENGKSYKVRAKYIVGADGGKSSVRGFGGIGFPGSKTTHRWVRVDGVLKTNMPIARVGVGSLESSTHGNVLWACLDHGATRVGFSLSPSLYEKYGRNMTEEDCKRESIAALAPFTLEWLSVDWWTVYAVEQRIADHFLHKDRILLIGDAAHTHSSGSAQGLNTGIQDAANLGWKLAGVIKGWYKPEILETYAVERRAVATELIQRDKIISDLMSGKVPEDYRDAILVKDPNVLLGEHQVKYAEFLFGLGIGYADDPLLNRLFEPGLIPTGHRAPDMLIRKPGLRVPTRLFEVTKNTGKFWIVVFAGNPAHTKSGLSALRAYLDGPDSFTKRLKDAFSFITIIVGSGFQVDEALGVEAFGVAFYDPDESVHIKYGVVNTAGAIMVLRPDGIVSFGAFLNDGAEVGNYLDKIISA